MQPTGPDQPFSVRTFRGSGTLPQVDLDDSAGLRDLMDGLR